MAHYWNTQLSTYLKTQDIVLANDIKNDLVFELKSTEASQNLSRQVEIDNVLVRFIEGILIEQVDHKSQWKGDFLKIAHRKVDR